MRRRDFIAALGGAAGVASPFCAWPQTANKRPLIAYLDFNARETISTLVSAFIDGIREVGYVEGQNLSIVYFFADNDSGRLSADATEIASINPNVIVALSPPAILAAKKATSSIPIVGTLLVDPVEMGLIESYAHPGGNLTGFLIIIPGLWGKIVEILRELVPSATMIGLLFNPKNRSHVPAREEVEAAGAKTGVKIAVSGASAPSEIEPALQKLVGTGVQGLIVVGDPMFLAQRTRIAPIATAAHLPTISNLRDFVDAGCLISYGVRQRENARRTAYFVDKILKGTKPADLPVEFPTQIEMVVNTKTAKALGITIPPSILLRADDVIE